MMKPGKYMSQNTTKTLLWYFSITMVIYFGWSCYVLYQENYILHKQIQELIVERDVAVQSHKNVVQSASCDKIRHQLHTLRSERDVLNIKLIQMTDERDFIQEELYEVISNSSYTFSWRMEFLSLKHWLLKEMSWVVIQPYKYFIDIWIYIKAEYISFVNTNYIADKIYSIKQKCLVPFGWFKDALLSLTMWSLGIIFETVSLIVQFFIFTIQSVLQLLLDALFWALYSIFRLCIIVAVVQLMGMTKKYSSTSTIRTSFLGYFVFCEVSGFVKWLSGIRILDTPYFNWPQPGGLVGVDDITWVPSWLHQEYTFFTWFSQLVVGGLVAMIFGYLPGLVADKLVAQGLDKGYCILFVIVSWLLLLFEFAAMVSWLSGLPIGQMNLINWDIFGSTEQT